MKTLKIHLLAGFLAHSGYLATPSHLSQTVTWQTFMLHTVAETASIQISLLPLQKHHQVIRSVFWHPDICQYFCYFACIHKRLAERCRCGILPHVLFFYIRQDAVYTFKRQDVASTKPVLIRVHSWFCFPQS